MTLARERRGPEGWSSAVTRGGLRQARTAGRRDYKRGQVEMRPPGKRRWLPEELVGADYFKHDFADNRHGLVYERGFLCSLPPTRRADYSARMARLVPPGGKLVGLFLYEQGPEPPPYPLTEAVATDLFGSSFRLVHSEAVTGSVPVYQALEHWQEWKRIAG